MEIASDPCRGRAPVPSGESAAVAPSTMEQASASTVFLLATLLAVAAPASAAPSNLDKLKLGGISQSQFLTSAIEQSSPGNARVLAELFGGLDLGLSLGSGTQAVISVGGAATRCQHQSPCFDSKCQLCYDPLLRVHGLCGGASYFTCRGTLPDVCLPYSCTAKVGRSNGDTVFVKKFSRYQDTFCLSDLQSAQNSSDNIRLNSTRQSSSSSTSSSSSSRQPVDPEWVITVPAATTQCQGYDMCLDLRCGACFDPYLGAHTSCGKMSYYDCTLSLPLECRPVLCTETNVTELFSAAINDGGSNSRDPKSVNLNSDGNSADGSSNADTSLMVRNFGPLQSAFKICT